VGGRVSGRFADGVAWVELSGVDQGDLATGTIAVALGIRQRVRQSMLESLVAGLSARQLLLVLDNCEQIAGAAG
jgi:predicted ATPase